MQFCTLSIIKNTSALINAVSSLWTLLSKIPFQGNYAWDKITHSIGGSCNIHVADSNCQLLLPTATYRNIKIYPITLLTAFCFLLTTFSFAQCPVNPNFSFTQTCGTGAFSFHDLTTATSGSVTAWAWDFGDGGNSVSQNPSHTFVTGASYNVTLTVTHSSGCTKPVTISVYVSAAPTANFTFNPNNVCAATTINFTNSSAGYNLQYNWNFGDGQNSTQQNPTHVFPAYGGGNQNYNVVLTVTDANGCTATISKVITIKQSPEISFFELNNYITCLNSIGSISVVAEIYNYSPNPGNIASYTIDWGAGGGAQNVTPPFDGTHPITHTYTALGSYPITVTATGTNGCITTFNHDYVIETNPVASIQGPAVGTNVGCGPLTVSVTNTSTNITSTTITTINWGDGSPPTVLPIGTTGNTASHTYTNSTCNAGTITPNIITLTAQNLCDASSTTWSPIKVYTPPKSSFSASKTSACVGDNIIFTNMSLDNLCATNTTTIYTWNFGDGTIVGPAPALSTMTHSYSAPGVYNVNLLAANNSTNGCGSTDTTIQINISQLSAQFAADTVCFGETTQFTDLSVSAGSTVQSWSWSFNDDGVPWWNPGLNQSTLQNPTHQFTHPGIFNVELTVTDANSCSRNITLAVVVDSLPVANFNWDPFCFGNAAQFHDLSQGVDAPLSSWQWNFGDGGNSILQNPAHTFATTGTFNVTLTVTTTHGCTKAVTKPVTVSAAPVANFSFTAACLGLSTQFTDNSTVSGTTINSWQWNFGNSNTSTSQNPGHNYASLGTYNVSLTVTDANGCTATITKPVTVNGLPTAQFGASQVCFGQPTVFTNSSTGTSWNWTFGDGGTSTAQNPAYTYLLQGTFNATLTATDANGCTASVTHPVTVDSVPHIVFSNSVFCFGNATQFTNLSHATGGATIGSWSWNFGDGQTSTQQNPSHTYATAQSFSVTLTATDSKGCTATLTTPLTAYPPPMADFTGVTGCSGSGTQFTDHSTSAAGNIVSWNWNFGDSNTSTQQNPSHTYGSSGTFPVQLIVTDVNGCKDTIVKNVASTFTITANFSSTTVCVGGQTCFTDLSTSSGGSVTQWDWSFNDPNVPWWTPWQNSSGSQNPCHTYTVAGTYTVDLSITDASGCTSAVSLPVTVSSGPAANFSANNASLGDPTQFTDLSTQGGAAIVTWNWNFGNGAGTSTQQNPQYTYPVAGTYTVTLTITDAAGCTATITNQVTVVDMPHAEFTASVVCMGSVTQFTDQSSSPGGSIVAWNWDFGDFNNSTVQNPSHTYTMPGTFPVTLIATDVNGISDTVTHSVIVKPFPTPQFTWTTVCGGGITQFTDQSVSSSGSITAWSWAFNDDGVPWWNPWGNSSSQQNPTHQFTHFGMFSVDLTVTDNNGCTATITHSVSVNQGPTAEFNVNTYTLLGNQTSFTDASVSGGSPITQWSWTYGDGQTSPAQNPGHTYTATGTYTVTLTVTDSNGCTSTVTHTVTVYDGPITDFTFADVCFGQTTAFDDNSVNPGAPITGWQWNFDDGSTSTDQNPDHQFAAPGTYHVQLIVTDLGASTDTIVKDVAIYAVPVADFSSAGLCENDTAQFTDLSVSSGGTIDSWDWNFGDYWPFSNTSTAQNPMHIFSLFAGDHSYNVQLTVEDNNGCSGSVTHTVIINQNPVAEFSSNSAVLGDPTFFSDLSTASGTPVDWSWDFGDGSGSSLQNPNHTYSSEGAYTVTLTVTDNNGCTGTVTHTVVVNLGPIANFGVQHICMGDTTQFIDSTQSPGGAISSWSWNFGDPASGANNASAIQNPAHFYASLGNYTVTLIVTDVNNITDTMVKQITIHPVPTAEFSADTACNGMATHFTDMSNNVSIWLWDFSDGYYSSVQNPNHHFDTTGAYNVSLHILDNFGCEDIVNHSVTVSPSPVAGFSDNVVCPGTPTIFTDLSTDVNGIVTWDWNFGDGSSSAAQNPQHVYTTGGTYSTALTVTNSNGCTATTTQPVTVYQAPDADFASNTAMAGSPVNFTDISTATNGAVASWQWNFGDSNTSAQQNPAHTYFTEGVYFVTLVVTDQLGCTDSITKQVIVYSATDVTAAFSASVVCYGSPTVFTDLSFSPNGTIVSWLWEFGDGTTSAIQDPVHSFTNPGVYFVRLTVTDSDGETDIITQQVAVNSSPNANFSATTVVVGNPTNFIDLSTGGGSSIISWNWNFGDGTGISNTENPVYTYTTSGNYIVSLIVTNNNGCSDTLYSQVTVTSGTAVTAAFSTNPACAGTQVQFADQSVSPADTIITWQWDFGDGNTSALQNPNHIYLTEGTYPVSLTVTDGTGSSDVITHPVTVNPVPVAVFNYMSDCSTKLISFSNQSVITGGFINASNWNFGDGNASSFHNPQHVYADFGMYTVSLTVTSDQGCAMTVALPVEVTTNPVADFSSNPNCVGYPTYFNDLSTVAYGTIDTWRWILGDGTESALQNTDHIYASAGDYEVTFIVSTASGCTDTVVKTVQLNFSPFAAFTTMNVCVSETAAFTDFSTIAYGSVTEWHWNFGDGDTSDSENPQHSFIINGTYNVTLITVSNLGCMDTIVQPVTIYPLPEVEFYSNTVCSATATQFENETVISGGYVTSWLWDFGDGGSSSMPFPAHLYGLPGTYNVTLNALSDFGCASEHTESITVNSLPAAEFTYTNACNGNTTIFTDASVIVNGAIASWNWNFGDGVTAPLQSPNHAYAGEGVFLVSLRVTSLDGCTDSITKVVPVYSSPLPEFTFTNVCEGEDINFTDQTTISSGTVSNWQWNFGDGGLDTQQNPSHLYGTAGNYDVEVIVTSNNGCMDSVTHTVEIYPVPVTNFTVPTVCSGNQVLFTNTTVISSGQVDDWTWYFGDGGSSALQNPQHTYTAAGTFMVTLVASTQNGCNNSISRPVQVMASPQVNLGPDRVICNGDSALLDAGAGNFIYAWSNGSSGQTLDATHAGAYWVTVSDTSACFTVDTIILSPPTGVHLPNDTILCDGDILHIDAGTGFITYLWNDNPTATARTLTVTGSGVYWVDAVDMNNCTNRDTIVVTYYPKPQVDLGPDNDACIGTFTTLDASNSGAYFLWSTGASTPSINVSYTGTYWVRVGAGSCTNSDTITVTYHGPPVVNLGNDTLLCGNDVKILNAGNPGATYLWSTGEATQAVAVGKGYKQVWVQVEKYGCTGTDTLVIRDCNTNAVGVPSAFNPNSKEEKNRKLYVFGENITQMEFMVFNRFGEMIFSYNGSYAADIGWDGTHKNKQCEMEVYVYYLKATFADGTVTEKYGNVSLVK